jgi:ketosteroid isomerase-like protein
MSTDSVVGSTPASDSRRAGNLAVLTGYFDAMAAGGPPATMPFYHPEVVLEVPGAHAASGRYEGLEGVGEFGARMRAASGGTFSLTPVDLLASDDHVVTVARARAERHGTTLEWDRLILSEVRDGKLVRLRFFESDQAAVDALLGPPA